MAVSFKNRIALYYLTATAVLVALVFVAIFMVIKNIVYRDLDATLVYEAVKHKKEITIEDGRIRFINRAEMEEREHREVEVNPIFIQLVDVRGNVRDKSPNLKEGTLLFKPDVVEALDADFVLNGKRIRQRQTPITDKGKTVGFIITAISSENAAQLLLTLRQLLLGMYPLVLALLFGVTRWLAGRSIVPVKAILETTNRITESNLNERIPLPEQNDELFQLTNSINQLLARIESALEREKQFTADASHELRTPLSVLRGTLEVVLRKPRTPEEYVNKISLSIKEIDRMHQIVEQLLMLARFERPEKAPDYRVVDLQPFITNLAQRQQQTGQMHHTRIEVKCPAQLHVKTDPYLLEVILDNLISNAVKYSHANGVVVINVEATPEISISVNDNGMGIDKRDINRIFQPFFRSDALNNVDVKGTGLGLSLVQRACEQLAIDLVVESELGKGSTFTLQF
jgi:two-component system, OmpR family, heavy metal sensor histidine kinase CusS